jgi:hypothetical protein
LTAVPADSPARESTTPVFGKRGAKLVGKVAQYGNRYRLCYIRGPEGILIGLANSSGSKLPERIPWDVTVENQGSGV